MSTTLDERYGRSRRARNPRRRRLIIAAIAIVVVGAATWWALWTDALGLNPSAVSRDTGFSLIDDSHVTVSFDLTVTVGRTSACAIQSLNADYAIVGWKVILFPASNAPIRQFTEPLITSEAATTGLVYSCWLT